MSFKDVEIIPYRQVHIAKPGMKVVRKLCDYELNYPVETKVILQYGKAALDVWDTSDVHMFTVSLSEPAFKRVIHYKLKDWGAIKE